MDKIESHFGPHVEPWFNLPPRLLTGMRSHRYRQENHVKSSATALPEIISAIYQNSRTLEKEHFLEFFLLLLQQYIYFDTAWSGLSQVTSRGPVFISNSLFGLPRRYIDSWLRVKTLDFVTPRLIETPGRPVTISRDDAPRNGPFQNFMDEYKIARGMCIIFLDPVDSVCFHLCLYRHRIELTFSSRDLDLIEKTTPNLMFGFAVNRLAQLESDRTRVNRQSPLSISEFPQVRSSENPISGNQNGNNNASMQPLASHTLFDTKPIDNQTKIIAEMDRYEDRHLQMRQRLALGMLTPKEMTVSVMFGKGQTYKEIAKRIGISPTTVRHHLRGAYAKLGVRNKGELAWLFSRLDDPDTS